MHRRIIVALLLSVALALVVAPAVIAGRAILLGDMDAAFRVFGPVLLVPIGFLLLGVAWSFRRGSPRPRRGERFRATSIQSRTRNAQTTDAALAAHSFGGALTRAGPRDWSQDEGGRRPSVDAASPWPRQ